MKAIFVHGNSSSSSTFSHVSLSIPRHTVSLLGHDNRFTPDSYSMEALRLDLIAQLENERAFVLVGHSLGGHLCLEAVQQLPGLKGLILMGTPPLKRPLNLDVAFLHNPHVAQFFKEEYDEHYLQEVFKDMTVVTGHIQRLIEDFKKTDPAMRVGLNKDIEMGNIPDEVKILNDVTVPVLMIHGEHDPFISLNYIKSLRSEADFEIKVIKNCGHYPQLEKPGELVEIVEEFIQQFS